MLTTILPLIEKQLSALADAWLSQGGETVELWSGACPLAPRQCGPVRHRQPHRAYSRWRERSGHVACFRGVCVSQHHHTA